MVGVTHSVSIPDYGWEHFFLFDRNVWYMKPGFHINTLETTELESDPREAARTGKEFFNDHLKTQL